MKRFVLNILYCMLSKKDNLKLGLATFSYLLWTEATCQKQKKLCSYGPKRFSFIAWTTWPQAMCVFLTIKSILWWQTTNTFRKQHAFLCELTIKSIPWWPQILSENNTLFCVSWQTDLQNKKQNSGHLRSWIIIQTGNRTKLELCLNILRQPKHTWHCTRLWV